MNERSIGLESGEKVTVVDVCHAEVYVGLAEERGWRIAHVLDTHVHTDHLSRSRMLADLAGANGCAAG